MSKTCNNCGAEEKKVNVPFVVYQATAARQERQIRRMWIALIISVVLLFVSNAFWLWSWTQYDYESYEVTADGDSNANYIGQDGNIYNGGFGESETEN